MRSFPVIGSMKRNHIFILAMLTLFLLPACNAQGAVESDISLCVATWNVQNLFDAEDGGTEYEEYTVSSGWDRNAYESRLMGIRRVLDELPQSGDYILVLNEVEGSNVVEYLIKSHDLIKLSLRFYACTEEADSPIQIAVASSLPVFSAHVHAVGQDLRPILEVGFSTDFGKVFVLACHFKSNVGGVSETEGQRVAAASVVRQIARALEEDNPGALVLVCGDLNEECFTGQALSEDGPLPSSGEFRMGSWYNFWRNPEASVWPGGSYWYDGSWRSYDNILISQAGGDGSGWDYSQAGVVFTAIQKTSDGKPFSWDRRLLKGISDHLPIWVRFECK